MNTPRVGLIELAPGLKLGGKRLVLIAGPCVVEPNDTPLQTARRLSQMAAELDIALVFKASFDKANRTAGTSFRSIGFEEALSVLREVRDQTRLPVLTDVHETWQVERVAEVVDVLQIPAFLCRQTDLLRETGRSGKPVNIKRGQFMAPEDMAFAVDKVREMGNLRAFLTERGASFGYHNLVVDLRALPIMRRYCPVVFDVTHSVQMPGGLGGASGGQRQYAPYLARAAAAAGVDGFFIETHPHPDQALSDGPNMIPLDELPLFLEELKAVWLASRPFVDILPG